MSKSILTILMGMLVLGISMMSWSAPMGTAFTYQGRLSDGGAPAEGEYDFEFKLYDDPTAGIQQGSTIKVENQPVSDGLFSVGLDLGSSVFTGQARWLQIGVRPGELADPNGYTPLSPRQEMTPTPYALHAQTAGDLDMIPGDPVHTGAITDDGTTELDGAYGIYVSGKYAYVASLSDNGVEILDISDPTNPTHVGAITDDGTTELYGAMSIYVSGKYAYVASYFDHGVEILDISDPANPTHAGAITDDGTTVLYGARSIYVSGKYAYVASYYDDGVEILDISDPTNPTHAGAITDDGTTVLDGPCGIYVSGKYAYVASSADRGVEILDISDPANPTHAGAITDDGTTELDGACGIYVSGSYAYVASSADNGVEILDISDPANPTHAGAITDDGTTELGGAWGIYVSGKYAYIASYSDDGVEILDISDPANPTHVGAITDDGTTELYQARCIYVSGKYAYVTGSNDDGVEILDISGIDAPSASIGDISTSTIDVTENADIRNNLYVGNAVNVGPGGLYVDAGQGIATDGDLIALGNVGIGTTDPGTNRLKVAGDMLVTGTANISNWFDQQLSTNGYAKIGNILIQWGTVSNADPLTEYPFPTPFPTECCSVVINRKAAGASCPVYTHTWDTESFWVDRNDSIDGWEDINYIAIGY